MPEPFEQEIKRTKGHDLLWAYSQQGEIKTGNEMSGIDMLRAVANALVELGEVDLKNHPPESITRMVNTLATVTQMLHYETNLLRKDHGLAPLTFDDIARRKKNV